MQRQLQNRRLSPRIIKEVNTHGSRFNTLIVDDSDEVCDCYKKNQ